MKYTYAGGGVQQQSKSCLSVKYTYTCMVVGCKDKANLDVQYEVRLFWKSLEQVIVIGNHVNGNM